MRKKGLTLLVVSLLPILLTGCWDYAEVDQMAIVFALGIDRVPGNLPILLTVQMATPAKSGDQNQGGGGGERAYMVLSSEGKSFSDAFRNLGMQTPRQICLSHNKLIVIGKDLAVNGIGEVLDGLNRGREIRRTSWFLTTDSTAREVLEKRIPLERIPADGLEQILLLSQNLGLAMPTNLNDFYANFKGVSQVSYAPFVQLENTDKKVAQQLEEETGRAVDLGENPETPIITGTAVFKNLRLAGILNQDEARAQMWLLDKPRGGRITFNYGEPAQPDSEGETIALDVLGGTTDITPQVTEDGIVMNIKCTVRTFLREAEPNLDLLDPQVVVDLENKASEILKNQIDQVIDKAQMKLKTDYVGFAESLDESYPDEWKRVKNNWDNIFPTIKYETTCKVKIFRFGITTNPTQSIKPEE